MLQPRAMNEIPEETVRVAKAAFPKGNAYMRLRDELGAIYEDGDFVELFEPRGRPAESPGFLAMVTVMQFAEGLTDRQAAEAVVGRIDWKYALGLSLTYTGFAHSILHEFRERVLAGHKEQVLLDKMLAVLRERGWVKGRGRQRTDSTHVLAAVRKLNRLECVGETMRRALNDLATAAPEWLLAQVGADWFARYGPRFENYRLPQSQNERQGLQVRIGEDGYHLLTTLFEHRPDLWQRPSVQVLRQVWVQQYYRQDGQVGVRTAKAGRLPPSQQLIQSPYDAEARYRTKRQTSWCGYLVHVTESCESETPHLIVHVATTSATVADGTVLPQIHQALAHKDVLPAEHLVDSGYCDIELVVESNKDYDIDLVGPLRQNVSWQAQQEDGYDLSCFVIDWEQKVVTCPQGKQTLPWQEGKTSTGAAVITTHFAYRDCKACPQRQRCTRQTRSPRTLTFRPQPQFERLQRARQEQTTQTYKQRYRARAGIEGTLSQAVSAFSLRQSRYIGLLRTHLQHLATAAALNLARIDDWLQSRPRETLKHSRFAALSPVT